jgi:hypothetical protein
VFPEIPEHLGTPDQTTLSGVVFPGATPVGGTNGNTGPEGVPGTPEHQPHSNPLD